MASRPAMMIALCVEAFIKVRTGTPIHLMGKYTTEQLADDIDTVLLQPSVTRELKKLKKPRKEQTT